MPFARIIVVLVLLLPLAYQSPLGAQSLAVIDSLRKAPLTDETLRLFFDENLDFLMQGLPEADSVTLVGLEMARELGNPSFLSKYHNVLSVGAHNNDQPRREDSLLEIGARYSLEAKDTSEYLYTQVARFASLAAAGDYGLAMQRGINLIPAAEQFGDVTTLLTLTYELARVSSQTEDHERTLIYIEQAMAYELAEPADNNHYYDDLQLLKGSVLAEMGRSDEALVLINEAIDSSRNTDADTQYEARLQRARMLMDKGEYTRARADLDVAKDLNPNYLFYLYNGQWLQEAGRYAEARQSLHQALARSGADERDNGSFKAQVYRYLQYHDLTGDQRDTARHYGNLMAAAIEQGARQTNAQLIKDMEVRYDTEEKQERIVAQQATLRQQQQTQNLTYGMLALVTLGVVGLIFGLRNNRRKNTLLAERNAQNELLLKEIHHRVKNNLETVSSLLELQSATLTDDQALAAMQAGQSRVQSMGLLHQKLYQGENLAAIEMKDYFGNLAAGLLETYEEEDRLTVHLDMPATELDVDNAVPLGLIVNELLTNAIKYAFPGADAGAIRVNMSKVAREIRLTVADNGVGKDFTAGPRGTGFGTRLVTLLTRQLGGQLTEANDGGLATTITFRVAD